MNKALDNLVLDKREYGCGDPALASKEATTPLYIYGREAHNAFKIITMGAANEWRRLVVGSAPVEQGHVTVTPIDRDTQYDAANIRFTGDGSASNTAQVFLQYTRYGFSSDETPYMNAESTLQFDIRVKQAPDHALTIGQHTVYPKRSEFRFNTFLPAVSEAWQTIKIPLACFPAHSMILKR